MNPLFLGRKSRIFWFFSILSRKSVSGSRSMGFVWGGVGRALMQFMHFSVIFAIWAVLATSGTPWYTL